MTFFQILLSTSSYKKSGTFNETFLTWSSLTCNIFSKKSWFLFSDKPQVQKSVDVITCFFCTVKNKNSEAARLIVGTPFPIPFQCYFSQSVWCMCVLFIYTILISVICVSQEELSLVASNAQMYDFKKWVIFKKKRHWKVNFWCHWIIQCNTDSCCEHMPDGVNIYLYGCVSLFAWMCWLSLCVYVCNQIRVPAKNFIMIQTSVNLAPCCIEHISRLFWY